jgi:hypothetical protein
MNKAILRTIKFIVIMAILVLMTIGKEMGMPVFIKYFIGLPIMYAVFMYNPNSDGNNEEEKLNKD